MEISSRYRNLAACFRVGAQSEISISSSLMMSQVLLLVSHAFCTATLRGP